jgi:hypothetical protein
MPETQTAWKARPFYKVQLDGTMVGTFGLAGKLPKESGSPTQLTAATKTNSADWRDDQLGVQRVTLKR